MIQLRRFILLGLLAASPIAVAAETAPAPAPTSPSAGVPGEAKPASKPQPAPAQVGTSAVVLDISAIASVMGMGVKSYEGEDLGHIVDLLVTPAGEVRAAILQFGGVLGVGDRKVAVDWSALDFKNAPKGGDAVLALTRNQIRVSPEYKTGDPVVVLETTKKTAAAKAPPAGTEPPARRASEPSAPEPNKTEPAVAAPQAAKP